MRLVSASEAARLTGIKEAAIRYRMATGAIKTYERYKKTLVNLDEVAEIEPRVNKTGIKNISYSPIRKKYRVQVTRNGVLQKFESASLDECKEFLKKIKADGV